MTAGQLRALLLRVPEEEDVFVVLTPQDIETPTVRETITFEIDRITTTLRSTGDRYDSTALSRTVLHLRP